MKVFLPNIDTNSNELIIHKPKNKREYLGSNEKCNIFVNKPPVWNESKNLNLYFIVFKTYTLKFNGRVQIESSKNFQLIKENGNDIFLQFGMIDEDTFAMDFQYPLTPYQAFAICLSSLATKKICE